MSDPLEGLEHELFPTALSGRLSPIELPGGVEQDPLYLAYLGLWSLLERRTSEALGADADARLAELQARFQALEGPIRFELFEATRRFDGLERAGRITAGESRLKRAWLVPKLRAEIATYRARIAALRAALEAG